MTRYNILFAAALLSLAAGCDDNSLTNAPIDAPHAQFAKAAPEVQVLVINSLVPVNNDYLVVTGEIEYTVQFDDGSGASTVDMDTEGSARPYDGGTQSWSFSGISREVVAAGSSFTDSFILEAYPERGSIEITLTAGEKEITLDDIGFAPLPRNHD